MKSDEIHELRKYLEEYEKKIIDMRKEVVRTLCVLYHKHPD